MLKLIKKWQRFQVAALLLDAMCHDYEFDDLKFVKPNVNSSIYIEFLNLAQSDKKIRFIRTWSSRSKSGANIFDEYSKYSFWILQFYDRVSSGSVVITFKE